jgi:hypothetical protein
MPAELRILSQAVEITEVADVALGPPVFDPLVGDYVRDIRIFGPLPAGSTNMPLLFHLRLRGLTAEDIHVAVPAGEF